MLQRLKLWAKAMKRDVVALWLAARDPSVAWHAKLVAAMVAAYALSPIDLIPDFVPVLGYLDDLLIVPLGIMLTVRLVGPQNMARFRAEAEARKRPTSRGGMIAIVAVWLAAIAATIWLFWR